MAPGEFCRGDLLKTCFYVFDKSYALMARWSCVTFCISPLLA